MRAREDGRRRHPLHPLLERHDGQTEGHRAHHGGLPHRHHVDAQTHLRYQGRQRYLLVHRRHRLGHGPLVHRIRAARQSHDRRHLRRHAGLPRQGPLLGADREIQDHYPLYCADGDPHVHEVGAAVSRKARHEEPAFVGNRRRADQSGSMGLVLRVHRRRPVPRGRHVVADGDRDDPRDAVAGYHADQARFRHVPISGRVRGRRR